MEIKRKKEYEIIANDLSLYEELSYKHFFKVNNRNLESLFLPDIGEVFYLSDEKKIVLSKKASIRYIFDPDPTNKKERFIKLVEDARKHEVSMLFARVVCND